MKTSRLFVRALTILIGLFGVTTVAIAAFSAWVLDGNLTAEYRSKAAVIADPLSVFFTRQV